MSIALSRVLGHVKEAAADNGGARPFKKQWVSIPGESDSPLAMIRVVNLVKASQKAGTS